MPLRSMRRRVWAGGSLLLLVLGLSAEADLLESLGLRRRAREAKALGEEQIAAGLREALGIGVQRAVESLGKLDGFLKDAKVRIPLPDGLKKVETGLRRIGQGELADQFETAMNRAAEQAVPEAAGILGDSVKQMTLADARAILSSTNTAATDYFRRTSEAQLHSRLLPIVQEATAKAGVTGRYKAMLNQSGLGGGGLLGGLGRSLVGADNLDLDDYVTRKALDGLFVKIGDEEARIRENPKARSTELLKKVFGDALK